MIESFMSRARFRGIAALVPAASVILAAGCGSSARSSESSGALRSTARVAYYHATFGAGATVITRDNGSTLDERRYEPFGAAIDATTGPVDFARDPHNALNKETDAATGWSDHGARWLAPETARWLTPDPPLKAPDPKYLAEPWALHPYQYVQQNPILFWDPDGREPKEVDEELSPSEQIGHGLWALVPGHGQLPGLELAVAPLQSERVPTPAKLAYAVVSPVVIFVAGGASELLHTVVGLGDITVGTVRLVLPEPMTRPITHAQLRAAALQHAADVAKQEAAEARMERSLDAIDAKIDALVRANPAPTSCPMPEPPVLGPPAPQVYGPPAPERVSRPDPDDP